MILYSIFTKIAVYLTPGELNVPKGTPDSVLPVILRITFAVAGAISVLIITISGLRLVVSVGDPQAVSKTRNTIIYAVLGLVVCIAGYTIVTFVLNRV